MKSYHRNKYFLILGIIFLSVFICPTICSASEQETIKIGYIDYDGFIVENEDGSYSGYGVEYLSEISKYTGWKYEYVYDSFENNLKKLKNGTIDFFCHAQKTPEREKEFLYSSYSSGSEANVLYVRREDDRYYYNDYENFNGMNVAVLKGSYQNESFRKYAKMKGFTYDETSYDTGVECFQALKDKRVDAVAIGSLSLQKDFRVVSRCGFDPFYFISGKNNVDKMEQLNHALEEIKARNVSFDNQLYDKYYGNSMANTDPLFTREETEYIQNSKTIQVGLLDNRAPLSHRNEKGEPEGIVVDLMNLIANKSGLKFTYDFLEEGERSIDYLQRSESRLVAGVMSSAFSKLSNSLLQSESLLNTNIGIVGRKDTGFLMDVEEITVAVPKGLINGAAVIQGLFPKYKVYNCSTTDEALDAIRKGKADIMFQNIYVARMELQKEKYENLDIYPAYSYEESMKVVSNPEEMLLMSIIDKTIQCINKEESERIVIGNTLAKHYRSTIWEIIYHYRVQILGIIIIISIIIGFLLLLQFIQQKNLEKISHYNTQLEKANNQLADTNKRLSQAVSEADAANRAKSLFLARMSHEIRTPVNSVSGIITLARWHIDEPERMKEYLSKMEISIKMLLGIINDVLDMSAIENNKIRIENEKINLNDILESLSSVYEIQCRNKNVTYNLDVDAIEHFELMGDGLHLQQIFLNLVSNAYKFTPEGGTVTVKGEEVTNDGEKVWIRFSFSDTGEGMSEEMQKRVFKQYEQEDNNTAKKHGGSGLGLSIAKNLVELMSGTITFESKKNIGTTFVVMIPFGLPEAVKEIESGKASEDEVDFSGKRILMAEDIAFNAEIVIELLEMVNLKVDHEWNGKTAYERFVRSEKGTYDAVLLDIQMPEMNGYETAKAIRESIHPDAKKIPIIAMTANAFSEDIQKSFESGMNAHVAKPIDTNILYQTLKKWINP